MNTRYTSEEKDCWEHLYTLGFSTVQISDIRGVKKPSVVNHINSLGISRTHSEAQIGRTPWNKDKVGVQIAWNKGKMGVQQSSRKGTRQPKRGPRTTEDVLKIKEGWQKKLESGWNEWGGYGQKLSPEQRLLPGILYLVRYLDESGTHFKLGITKRNLSERLGDKLIAIIHLHTATLGECFDLEQSLLRWAKENGHRYSSPTTTELIHPDGLPYLLDRLTALCLS
jgi:hypothetical protein